MTPERWQQVARIYERAVDEPAERRSFVLSEWCGEDEDLRCEVESLLDQDGAGLVLDRPALAAAAPLFDSGSDVKPGSALGPYRIDAVLGTGGMGEVFRATDTRLDRVVAIKVLPTDSAGQPQMQARFKREARAIAALAHPNICTLHDVGSEGGVDFLVMEYIEGVTLAAQLGHGPLPMRQALAHAIAIGQALEHAHRQGIVHRDLKPANIMLTLAGPKLLDFGLATVLEPALTAVADEAVIHDFPAAAVSERESDSNLPASDRRASGLLGTIRYMAPEQLERRKVDRRTDVFAFGLVLFEMLTGRRVFDQEGATGVQAVILSSDPLPAASLPAHLPPSIRHIVRRCCAREPDERWQTAADVVRALTGVAGDLERAPGRSRQLAAVALTLLTIAGLSAVGWLATRTQPLSPPSGDAQIRSLAVLPLANLSGDPAQVAFADAMTEQLIEDLAGLGGLRVISSGSILPYRSSPKPMATVVRDLHVDAIVEGSVTTVEDTVRVSARLVRGSGGEIVWAQSYERRYEDVLALQSELARNITSGLGLALAGSREQRVKEARTVDPEVHRQVLLGRFHAGKATEAGLLTAIDYFNAALAQDPSSAVASAGLADVYIGLSGYYRDPREVMPQAKQAALRALSADESLATAHAALGWIHLVYDWDGPAARKELLRALDLNPTLATARLHYAAYLTTQVRHDEAVGEIRRAFESDPLSVRTNALGVSLLLFTRRYEEAIEMARKGLEFEPGSAFALAFQGVAFAEQGRLDEAVNNLARAAALDSSPTILSLQAHVLALAGQREPARALIRKLEDLSATSYFCPYEVGTAHASLGDLDSAERWFRKGIEGRADCMAWLGVEPWIESFRKDPRYPGLLRAIGLDPSARSATSPASNDAR